MPGTTYVGAEELEFDADAAHPEWDEPVADEPEESPGPAPEVLEHAQALAAEREQLTLAQLAKFGLTLAADGTPIIRDPSRFSEWAGPVAAPKGERVEPKPEPEPQPKQELWEMDEEKLVGLIQRVVEQSNKPLAEKLTRQETLLGKQWIEKAALRVPAALAEFAPDQAHILQHPEFGEKFLQAIQNMQPEWLENPQVLASTALGTVAFMDKGKMPRATPGARSDALRAQAARQAGGVQNYGYEAAAPARTEQDPLDNLRLRFLSQFVGETDAAELRALEAQDRFGFNTIDAYEKALAQGRRGKK